MAGLPSGVVAVVRTDRTDHALTLARGLLRAGIPGVEITMTVPDATQVIAALAPEAGGRVGAGTVTEAWQVAQCVAAGATYIVAPNLDPEVLARCRELGVAAVPGTLTPSEMQAAVALGASAVKVFPVSAVGGTDYLRAVLEPLPHLRIVASGGIQTHQVGEYLAAGAWAVCLGRALFDEEAVRRGDVAAVADFAAAALSRLPGR